MIKLTAKLLFIFTIGFYLLHFLFFGLFETTDSYFYWALGEFIKTGKYALPHPYLYSSPSTLEPPLFSVFLYVVQFFNQSDILIHLFHIFLLFTSAFLLYQILKNYLTREIAQIASIVFLLIPANIIQAASLMPEVSALFTVSLYVYLSYLIISKKKNYLLGPLFLLSSIMTLLRYNFIVFLALTFLLFLFSRPKKGAQYLYAFISIGIIIAWILINHALNGSWGLSNIQGKHLYDRIVAGDRSPPPSHDPNFIQLKNWLPAGFDIYQPWYIIEPHFIDHFGRSDSQVSVFLGKIALATLPNHLLEYSVNTLKNYYLIHGNGLIFPHDLYIDGPWMGQNCRTIGKISLCQPIVKNSFASIFWDKIIRVSESYYYHFPKIVNLFFFFPLLIFSFIQKDKFLRFCALIYFVASFTPVLFEVPVYRYLYPLYPVKIIIIAIDIFILSKIVKKWIISKQIQKSNIKNQIYSLKLKTIKK